LSRVLIESSARTDCGKLRFKNEDRFAVSEELGLFAVADGMGGHPSGDVAAAMALDAVHRFLADPHATWPPETDAATLPLVAAVKAANQELHKAGKAYEHAQRMGTTFVGALFDGAGVCIAHVGDSRCYRFRDGALALLTEDHTVLADELWKGTPLDVALKMPFKGVLTRAVGIHARVDVSARFENVLPGDLFLLCSDGLSKPVERGEITAILAEAGDLGASAERLIARANDRGGHDNITAVLIRTREPAC
jgi:PPM family protein phosphatase